MEEPRRPRPRWWLVVLGLAVAAAGGLWWLTEPPGSVVSATETSVVSDAPTVDPTVVPGVDLPRAERAPARPGAPGRVTIPALGVDARVIPIGAPGGVLTPPADPQTLGWWAEGARPGDDLGSALVTGHTVSTGGGALDDLEEVAPGQEIRVRSARATTAYTVRRVEIYSKGELAERSETLFDQEVPGRLVVITCEDWDGSQYLSNVVVTAVPS